MDLCNTRSGGNSRYHKKMYVWKFLFMVVIFILHLLRSVGNRVENLPAVIIDSFLKYFYALQLYPVALPGHT